MSRRATGKNQPFYSITLVWCILSVLSVCVLAALFGVPVRDTGVYLLYLLLYVLFPGVSCYILAVPPPQQRWTVLLHGFVVGQLLEMWSYLILWRADLTHFFPFYPLAALFLWGWKWRVYRERFLASNETPLKDIGGRGVSSLCLFALCLIFPVGLYSFQPPVDQHFTWVAAFANSLHTLWPPEDPFLTGVPLYYHYLPNIHLAATHAVSGLPILLLASRLFVIVHFWMVLALVVHFARVRFGLWLAGVFACTQLLSTYGYPPIGWQLFHHATASILALLPSTLLAFEILVVVWYETMEYLSRPQHKSNHFLLIAGIFFASSGIRAQLLPIILAGLFLLGGYVTLTRRSLLPRMSALFTVGLLSLLFGLWFFYGLGTTTNATGIVAIQPFNATAAFVSGPFSPPSSFFQTVYAMTGSERIAAACSIAVALVGRLGFLLPGALLYILWFQRSDEMLVAVLLAGCYLAGVGAVIVLHSPFQEQWNFQLYGDLAIALIAAVGCLRAFASRNLTARAALCLSIPGLVLASSEFLPPFLQQVRLSMVQTEYPSYPIDSAFAKTVQRLHGHLPPRSVLVTGGELTGIDDRVLPVLVPGVQLFANRKQLRIYLQRIPPDPRLVRRQELLYALWQPDTFGLLRHEVSPDRPLFLLWVASPPPPSSPHLHLLFTEGRYALYRVDP
ncbi:MAG: hypothetical protein AB7G75_06105 [Candidatus Binatia bacterium]